MSARGLVVAALLAGCADLYSGPLAPRGDGAALDASGAGGTGGSGGQPTGTGGRPSGTGGGPPGSGGARADAGTPPDLPSAVDRPTACPGGVCRAMKVAVGMGHACALLADGSVRCWGSNSRAGMVTGQLGDPGLTAPRSLVPVEVLGVTGATAIAAGAHHTCALRASRFVTCWGANDFGQTNTASIEGALAVTAGEGHTCAIVTGGQATCVGRNSSGELGDGSATITPGPAPGPVNVVSLPNVERIAAGAFHTCGVTAGGWVSCWGQRPAATGSIGDGSDLRLPAPVPITGLVGVVEIAAGTGHTCAVGRTVMMTQLVHCWGRGDQGQLGHGAIVPLAEALRGAVVAPPPGVKMIVAGAEHTCTLTEGGAVHCWGNNAWGALGAGDVPRALAPIAIPGFAGAVHLAAGGGTTCAVFAGGTVRCTGANPQGQVGDGTTRDALVPTLVRGL